MTSLRAQTTAPSIAPESLRVSLITMGPGEEIWEKWGHNAILIEDPASDIAVAYNYGIFDFNQPNFIGRFILGRMTYAVDAEYARPMLEMYARDDRDVVIQELNLTPQQARHLFDYLEWNRRPENREYLYEYYRNNCSTKVRDAFDRDDVLAGQIQQQLSRIGTGTSYRWFTRIGSAQNPLLYTGLQLALGRRTDRPISAWETSFVPTELAKHLRDVTVIDAASGKPVPLVQKETVFHRSTRTPLPARPPNWSWAYGLIGLAYAALIVWTAKSTTRRGRRFFGMLGVTWSIISGLAGAFLVFAMTTDHAAAHHNNNLLIFPPLSLVMIPLAISLVRRGKYARWARPTAMVIVGIVLVGILANAIPALRQWNWDLIALALPIHVALAYSMKQLAPAASAGTLRDKADSQKVPG